MPVTHCRGPFLATALSTQVAAAWQPGPDSSAWFPTPLGLASPHMTPLQPLLLPLQKLRTGRRAGPSTPRSHPHLLGDLGALA